MPKTKFQNVVFTAIMALCMVYGMIVYNVALNTGGVHAETFVLALHELYIMAPVAFVWRSPSCAPTTALSSSATPSPSASAASCAPS